MEVTESKKPEEIVKKKRTIIDSDIHNYTSLDEIKKYLPRVYREQIDLWGWRLPGSLYLNGGTNVGQRADSIPPDGGFPGSDLDFMRMQYLDPSHVEYGILTGSDYSCQATPDIDYAAALSSAINDYTLEQWVNKDHRLKGSIIIPKQDPRLSVQEIHRVGSHPDMVQVIVASGAEKPYGNRFYHPIYEACVEHNLPFTIHVLMEGVGINPPTTGAGYVSYYPEYRATRPQVMAAHLASLIYEGVFEKFPTLQVVLQEAGVFWMAPYLWKMDEDWKSLRFQTPWVKKKPSEYFRSNIKVSSQPLEKTPNPEMFRQMMKAVYADETLLYCSDYPHWDFDSPVMAFPKLEDELWERIFYQNAAELYGLPARKDPTGGID
ncbi:amidohydrolase [Peribacillus cavernae]|uniref:Amidohydrolase n=1 Tax=Peribacillus cavernae TaxID=1674310 RepID=A0A3S0W4Z3_9BACI|nr:amidohydrolase family protein [Peribacillus cavernae]MDQ0218152.1 putative TIM-barrel fold metal-dependent hydrolase [Peribacillus cavernae]RUQ32698.1 amidohydrolase [Peribacillus cavernae]